MLSYSAHFNRRLRQRGLRRDVLDFILEFGEVRSCRQATWLVVTRRSLPDHIRDTSLALRAAQWLLLMQNGVLITCYRCDSPLRKLSRSH
jgi:hypothetical protein